MEVEVEDSTPPMIEVFSGTGMEEMGINMADLFGGMFPKRKRRRKVTVKEARQILTSQEAQKLIDLDSVHDEAIARAEQEGIVFIDEIDKIAGVSGGAGPDVSREGVQRDILPIVEGTTVVTKYGPVRTDHILFIAAGAFHVSKLNQFRAAGTRNRGAEGSVTGRFQADPDPTPECFDKTISGAPCN